MGTELVLGDLFSAFTSDTTGYGVVECDVQPSGRVRLSVPRELLADFASVFIGLADHAQKELGATGLMLQADGFEVGPLLDGVGLAIHLPAGHQIAFAIEREGARELQRLLGVAIDAAPRPAGGSH